MLTRRRSSRALPQFSPGDYSRRRADAGVREADLLALANEFLCVSIGCVMIILVAYVAHHLARNGILTHVTITGF